MSEVQVDRQFNEGQLNAPHAEELDCLSIHNSRVPISRLPPELLLEILNIYKHGIEEADRRRVTSQSRPYGPWDYTYSWIVVTHVCSYWRSVTLSSPGFWSTICMPSTTTSVDWIHELLSRSQSATLSFLSLQISISQGEISAVNHPSHLLCHNGGLRPTRRLRLLLYANDDSNPPQDLSLSNSSVSSFDALEEITIHDYTLYYTSFQLLSQVFAPRASNLQSLSLRGYPWDSHDWSGSDYPNVTWNTFLRTLASLRQLRHLDLSYTFVHLDDEGATEVVPIHFPRLQTLVLHLDKIKHYTRFIKSISIPPTTRVDITPFWYINRDATLVDLFKGLSESFDRHSKYALLNATHSERSSLNQNQSFHGAELTLYQYSLSPTLSVALDINSKAVASTPGYYTNIQPQRDHSCNISCRFFTTPVPSPFLFPGIVEHLQTLVSAHHFRSIHLSYKNRKFSQLIVHAFSGFRELRTLTIVSYSSFLPALSSGIPDCNCTEYDDQHGVDSLHHELLCQTCRAFLLSYFAVLQRLVYLGLPDQELRQEEKKHLKRILWYFSAAGRMMQRLEFRGWVHVPIYEFKSLCGSVLWTEG
ncbi:hypothetical protein AX16_010876 [Volvariella volvacea WC 439]|nr:hypothetical protein AX16_010876 [Volvariella volvacea WC 439]